MKQYEKMLGGVIVAALIILALADTIRHLLGYLIVLTVLAVIYRLLLGDRGGR